MKALGTGIGAFALTDVEVRRTPGRGADPQRPVPGAARRARPSWPGPRAPAASTSR